MKRGNIITFTIDRAKYHLSPLKPNRPTTCIGAVQNVRGDKIRIRFNDIFGDGERYEIEIDKKNIVEVI